MLIFSFATSLLLDLGSGVKVKRINPKSKTERRLQELGQRDDSYADQGRYLHPARCGPGGLRECQGGRVFTFSEEGGWWHVQTSALATSGDCSRRSDTSRAWGSSPRWSPLSPGGWSMEIIKFQLSLGAPKFLLFCLIVIALLFCLTLYWMRR